MKKKKPQLWCSFRACFISTEYCLSCWLKISVNFLPCSWGAELRFSSCVHPDAGLAASRIGSSACAPRRGFPFSYLAPFRCDFAAIWPRPVPRFVAAQPDSFPVSPPFGCLWRQSDSTCSREFCAAPPIRRPRISIIPPFLLLRYATESINHSIPKRELLLPLCIHHHSFVHLCFPQKNLTRFELLSLFVGKKSKIALLPRYFFLSIFLGPKRERFAKYHLIL